MDYTAFCKIYFAVTNIPVSLMKKNEAVYSSIGEVCSIEPARYWEMAPMEDIPNFYRYSPDIEYGGVHIIGTDYTVILGPAFSVPITKEIIRTYMHENTIALEHQETITEFLCAIPRITHQQFTKHLALIHMSLNQKEVKLQELYHQDDAMMRRREEQNLNEIINNFENNSLHDSYYFEQELYQCIKEGNLIKLENFLAGRKFQPEEGRLASTPLRHAKNLFIVTAAKAGMLGAIPGGLDIEKTYQLMDLYIQECEKLQTIGDVKYLQYSMIQDFCRHTSRCPYPGGDLFRSVYLHELHPLPYKRIPGHRRHCMADPPERFLCPETLQGRAGNQYRGIYSTLQAGGSQSPPNLQRQKPYRDFQLPLFLKPVLFSECFQEKIWSDTYAVQKKDAACMTNRMPPQPMRMTSCLVQIIPFHFSALYLTDKTYS